MLDNSVLSIYLNINRFFNIWLEEAQVMHILKSISGLLDSFWAVWICYWVSSGLVSFWSSYGFWQDWFVSLYNSPIFHTKEQKIPVRTFLTRCELMLTPVANCRKLEFAAFFAARVSFWPNAEQIPSAFTAWHHQISNTMVHQRSPQPFLLLFMRGESQCLKAGSYCLGPGGFMLRRKRCGQCSMTCSISIWPADSEQSLGLHSFIYVSCLRDQSFGPHAVFSCQKVELVFPHPFKCLHSRFPNWFLLILIECGKWKTMNFPLGRPLGSAESDARASQNSHVCPMKQEVWIGVWGLIHVLERKSLTCFQEM